MLYAEIAFYGTDFKVLQRLECYLIFDISAMNPV